MKQITEQNRKFIDMVDLKVYHSIYPVIFSPGNSDWGCIIRFDDKIILPGKRDIQNFSGSSLLIVRMLINGSAVYHDATGYRKVLKENDVLVVAYGEEGIQSTYFNFNETDENEFLEIWFKAEASGKRRHFYPANASEKVIDILDIPAHMDYTIDLAKDSWLWRGTIAKNTDHVITQTSTDDSIVLFVLSGSMTVNHVDLNYRDAIILSLTDVINIHFERETDLLIIQMRRNKEEVK